MKKLIQTGLCLLIYSVSYTQTTSTFIDSRDGKTYEIVKIGNQWWMAENLAYLPAVSPSALPLDNGIESLIKPYYYVYGYNGSKVDEAKSTENFAIYGVLYNWVAAMNGEKGSNENPSGVQGVCPCGWHLPSDKEWTELTDYLGGRKVAGGKLKESGHVHWHSPNEGATNESGFKALPGGSRKEFWIDNSHFLDIGYLGYWWSATETHDVQAHRRFIYNNLESVIRFPPNNKRCGLSVRCIKDY
jgi:uncharacterized protein (TIGR02145 family)